MTEPREWSEPVAARGCAAAIEEMEPQAAQDIRRAVTMAVFAGAADSVAVAVTKPVHIPAKQVEKTIGTALQDAGGEDTEQHAKTVALQRTTPIWHW